MKPTKLCLGPPAVSPWQLTPPPNSHPRSPVKDIAILSSITTNRGRRSIRWRCPSPQVAGEGHRHLIERLPRFVVILDLDTVVGVDAAPIRNVQIVMAEAVIVGDDIQPGERRIFDLPSETLPRVGGGVRLPSVDK